MALLATLASTCHAQNPADDDIERPPVPRLDPLEVDANGDGVPDGWYNLRDAKWVDGGVSGPKSHCLRFENARPGRPARASRAFGVDGRKIEAIVLGLWVRAENIGPGERMGDEPGLLLDLLGHELRVVRRGALGPWTKSIGREWTRVVKRIAVPPETRDAILSLGLIGATGVLEVDDLALEMVPVGATADPSLVVNGDFELGDPGPSGWMVENGATRAFPGHDSPAAADPRQVRGPAPDPAWRARAGPRLAPGRRGLSGEGPPRGRRRPRGHLLPRRRRPAAARADRPAAALPLDRHEPLGDRPRHGPRAARGDAGRPPVREDPLGGIGPDRRRRGPLESSPGPRELAAVPRRDQERGWLPVEPSKGVAAGSALDASGLLDAPAGKHGFVAVKGGRLAFEDGTRARFFGVQLLPPVAFSESDRADALADRLARSGVNLVRLGDLDSAYGPARSLFDDTREDTREFDPVSLARLDHLIAALKKRGIYVALELQSAAPVPARG